MESFYKMDSEKNRINKRIGRIVVAVSGKCCCNNQWHVRRKVVRDYEAIS